MPAEKRTLFDFLKWSISLLGHLALWSMLFNVLHATAFSRPGKKISEKLILLAVFGPVLWVLVQWFRLQSLRFDAIRDVHLAPYYYGWTCILIGIFFVGRWVFRKLTFRSPRQLIEHEIEVIDVADRVAEPLVAGRLATWLGSLPFNQITSLQIDRRTLRLETLPASLDGLKIVQISDLHFTGQILPRFFHEVVKQANAFEPDLVVLTGDVVDESECLDWIEPVLRPLKAKYGKFYVLGNHDLRIPDEALIREPMQQAGFTALQDQWESISIDGKTIWLAGNELPWFQGAERLPPIPESRDEFGFRILLSHTPDQLSWAIKRGFDLMFAGHTHGGQICFPVVGPVIAPSRHGIKYCGGTFSFERGEGRMVMHVTRGLSGDDPIRVNCRPELGLFTLKSGDQKK